MLILLTIIVIACAILFCTSAERGRAVGLAVGLLCMVLGGRAVALLSDSYSGGFISHAGAQEVVEQTTDSAEAAADSKAVTDQNADEPSGDPDATSSEVVEETSQEPSRLEPESQVGVEPESDALPEDTVAESVDSPEVVPDDSTDDIVIGTVTDVEFMTERPDWVETKPTLEGDVHIVPIDSGLYSRKGEADRALLEQMEKVLADYVDDQVGQAYGSKLVGVEVQRAGDSFELFIDGRMFEIADAAFEEQVRVSVGVMHQSHALVKLDKSVRERIAHRWSEVVATARLLQMGLGAAVVLLLLGTAFGYFKLDTATRGYYTGRLQFGAAAAILALIAASVVLGKWVPWL